MGSRPAKPLIPQKLLFAKRTSLFLQISRAFLTASREQAPLFFSANLETFQGTETHRKSWACAAGAWRLGKTPCSYRHSWHRKHGDPRAAASALPGDVERALRQVIGALEAQTQVLRAELAGREERIGALEKQQVEDRVRIAEFGRIEKRVQEKLGQAHRTIGALRAELVAAQAAGRPERTTGRSGTRPGRAERGGRVASTKATRVAAVAKRTKRAARKQKPGRVAPARRGRAQRRVTSRGSKR